MKKSELASFIKEEIKSTLNTEGVWKKGHPSLIQKFIDELGTLKNDYYNIVGSDDVFNGLDQAERAAKELMSMAEATIETSPEDLAKVKQTADKDDVIKVTEEDDKEPSKSDLKKTKGLAKAKEELAQLTKQMKSLARDYKKAEGEEKEKLVADLKKKTKLKKELEAIIDK
jgi:hypothetical protein